jgi:hypothetical protein
MTNTTTTFYSVVYDNGDDAQELEQFDSHSDALAYLKKEADEWVNGTSWDEEKEMIDEDCSVCIEVIKQDREDDDVYEPMEAWDSEDGFEEEDDS